MSVRFSVQDEGLSHSSYHVLRNVDYTIPLEDQITRILAESQPHDEYLHHNSSELISGPNCRLVPRDRGPDERTTGSRSVSTPYRYTIWGTFQHLVYQIFRNQCDIYIPNSLLTETNRFLERVDRGTGGEIPTSTTFTDPNSNPHSPKPLANVVFYVHGGGYVRGSKDDIPRSTPVMSEFFSTISTENESYVSDRRPGSSPPNEINALKFNATQHEITDGDYHNNLITTTAIAGCSLPDGATNANNTNGSPKHTNLTPNYHLGATKGLSLHDNTLHLHSTDPNSLDLRLRPPTHGDHLSPPAQTTTTPQSDPTFPSSHVVVALNYSLSSSSLVTMFIYYFVFCIVGTIIGLMLVNIALGIGWGITHALPGSGPLQQRPGHYFKWANIYTIIAIYGFGLLYIIVQRWLLCPARYYHPQHAQDVLQCVKWTDENLLKIVESVDLSKSVITGHSAGGSIVAFVMTEYRKELKLLKRIKFRQIITISGLYNYLRPSHYSCINMWWWILYVSGSIGYLSRTIEKGGSTYVLRKQGEEAAAAKAAINTANQTLAVEDETFEPSIRLPAPNGGGDDDEEEPVHWFIVNAEQDMGIEETAEEFHTILRERYRNHFDSEVHNMNSHRIGFDANNKPITNNNNNNNNNNHTPFPRNASSLSHHSVHHSFDRYSSTMSPGTGRQQQQPSIVDVGAVMLVRHFTGNVLLKSPPLQGSGVDHVGNHHNNHSAPIPHSNNTFNTPPAPHNNNNNNHSSPPATTTTILASSPVDTNGDDNYSDGDDDYTADSNQQSGHTWDTSNISKPHHHLSSTKTTTFTRQNSQHTELALQYQYSTNPNDTILVIPGHLQAQNAQNDTVNRSRFGESSESFSNHGNIPVPLHTPIPNHSSLITAVNNNTNNNTQPRIALLEATSSNLPPNIVIAGSTPHLSRQNSTLSNHSQLSNQQQQQQQHNDHRSQCSSQSDLSDRTTTNTIQLFSHQDNYDRQSQDRMESIKLKRRRSSIREMVNIAMQFETLNDHELDKDSKQSHKQSSSEQVPNDRNSISHVQHRCSSSLSLVSGDITPEQLCTSFDSPPPLDCDDFNDDANHHRIDVQQPNKDHLALIRTKRRISVQELPDTVPGYHLFRHVIVPETSHATVVNRVWHPKVSTTFEILQFLTLSNQIWAKYEDNKAKRQGLLRDAALIIK